MSLLEGLVIGVEKSLYKIWFSDEEGTVLATVRGRLFHEAADPSYLPVIGDHVKCHLPQGSESGVIEEVLPRRSFLARKGAGETNAPNIQPLAANVDYVLIASSLNQDLNWNRMDRYLTMSFDSGAQPVLVLTKRDLHPDWSSVQAECEAHSPGVPVRAVSTMHPQSWEFLEPFLSNDKVAVVVGSSGVGKSSLINQLLGNDVLDTGSIRVADDKGRHTTTNRSMWRTRTGGWIIDTPGMRELQLLDYEVGLAKTFDDVEELFTRCRFGNCQHVSEPHCAVKDALEDGSLDADRWKSYCKLQREIKFRAAKSKRR